MTQQLPLIVYAQETKRPFVRRRICALPAEERPLYRLHQHGSEALAVSELLALLLGTAEAPGIATDLLARFGSLYGLARARKEQLMKIRGIGEAPAAAIIVAHNLPPALPTRRLKTSTSPASWFRRASCSIFRCWTM
jgi:DNA repair protein RadC